MMNSEYLCDERAVRVKDTNTPWTLRDYPTLEAWEARAAWIRQHILVCLGLWPEPEKTPLRPRIFGRIEREGYSVEKVYFESLPGFFVCGNLYRPLAAGPVPGIACPHGHWPGGRLEDSADGSIPGRCINLARQGHVAFSYDMAGYLDSDQISHRSFGGPREDLWGIGLMGLQLWNGIRTVDFLCSLDQVDGARIGCSGASGGGTQTFMLAAVDDRVRAAAPVNMVSAHMQGGCACENQGHLRLDLNNVEIAAAMAPRPLLLVAATGDWTVDTPELEYPAVQRIYRLYGAQDRVSSKQIDAGHNYNRESREAVYRFFGRWFLGGGTRGPFREQAFVAEAASDLLVFSGRARPSRALDADRLVQAEIKRAGARWRSLTPRDGRSLAACRRLAGPALAHALGAGYPDSEALYRRDLGRTRGEDFVIEHLMLGRIQQGERVPAVLFAPRPRTRRSPATLVVHPAGTEALTDPEDSRPGPLVADLLERGSLVLAIDLFPAAACAPPGGEGARDRGTNHFATYNQTDAACRVQDILTGLAHLEARADVGRRQLLGLEGAGIPCLLALALSRGVARAAVDFGCFAADQDESWVEQCFIPGVRGAGDLRAALALIPPAALLVHHLGAEFPRSWARRAYRADGREERLNLAGPQMEPAAAVDWLAQA